MKNSQKGFISVLILVAIALIVIGGGTYIYFQNQPSQKEVSSITSTTTSPTTSTPTKKVLSGNDFSLCLSPDITLSTIVSNDGNGNVVTVNEKLTALGASCVNHKLLDKNGKEIYFYKLTGCWGNPPDDYQDIMKKQQDEINSLKQRYTVVELTCNPSGRQIQ